MEFLVLEQEKKKDLDFKDNKIINRRFDYNLYFSIENEEEEMQVIKVLKKFFNYNYRILRYNNVKELVVFLPQSTKSKALEFSVALRKKMKKYNKSQKEMEKIEKKKEEIKPIPIKPTRFISLTGFKNRERVGIFDEKLKLLYEIEKPKNFIKEIKEIMEVRAW